MRAAIRLRAVRVRDQPLVDVRQELRLAVPSGVERQREVRVPRQHDQAAELSAGADGRRSCHKTPEGLFIDTGPMYD